MQSLTEDHEPVLITQAHVDDILQRIEPPWRIYYSIGRIVCGTVLAGVAVTVMQQRIGVVGNQPFFLLPSTWL